MFKKIAILLLFLVLTVVVALGARNPGVWDTSKRAKQTRRLYPAILNDTATPHQLTLAEVDNTVITTQGWNGTDDITFNLPDISAFSGTERVYRVVFLDSKGMQDADTDYYIDPDGSTQIVLNGTITGTDGDRIWEDNITIYFGITCHSDYDGTLGGYWVCDSTLGTWADKGS